MLVKEILDQKGHQVFTISSNAMLSEVVDELVSRNCGSLVVCDRGEMVGIVTERDILRIAAEETFPLSQLSLRSVMQRNLITVSPSDKVREVMGVMTERRIRHLPVLDNGQLAGIVSIGDVVKAQHTELMRENQLLKQYILS